MRDENLLRLFDSDPEAALRQAIAEYGAMVERVVRQRLGQHRAEQDIEEIVSDVFASLCRSHRRIDPKLGSLRSYLAVSARNAALRRARQLSERLSTEQELSEDIPISEGPALRQEQRELWEAVLSLGKPDSDILILRYFYGLKSREIAKALGFRHNTVDKRASRALERLRRLLKEEE
ncbi:MAG: sigma-70 family RNA polymerase sigma factor [Ruminococcus sp.]|nr:sigma-70 family RNA polymerase sigma factor [Ruminococcus sp.]